MSERGLMIVLSGPSGVGKDAVLDKFMPQSPDCVKSISATTRTPRVGEVHGKDYFFLTREEFQRLASKGDMLEYTEYNGNYYGTPKQAVEDMLNRGQNVILKIEVDGGLQVKHLYPEAVLIFLIAPNHEILKERLEKRGTESGQALENRMAIAKFELSKVHEYDYIIINDTIDKCCERLLAVKNAAKYDYKHMHRFIKEEYHNA